MSCSKLIPVMLAAACLAVPASAHAQRRAGGGGGRSVGTAGPRGGSGRSVGTAAPRGGAPGRPVVVSPGRVGGGAYYRPYSYPYRYYRPGLSFGFYGGFGYPYYYPYGYAYPYYSPYGYAYPGYYGGYYGGDSYAYPPSENGRGWGGVRIQDAPRDAQVFADGYYVGIVDDFDGLTQHLTLEAGVHHIEIRVPGQQPRVFDVNVQVGQTINYHAR